MKKMEINNVFDDKYFIYHQHNFYFAMFKTSDFVRHHGFNIVAINLPLVECQSSLNVKINFDQHCNGCVCTN